MNSQTSILEECRAAYHQGQAVKETFSTDTPQGLIRAFLEDKRVLHFKEDMPVAIEEIASGGTLMDANLLDEGITEIDVLLGVIQSFRQTMVERKAHIISDRAAAGILEEGPFELTPIISKTNRTPDLEKIKTEAPAKWDLLLNLKIEEVKASFKPNQTSLKTVFGKGFEKYLIPGSEEITGYKMGFKMPEQASTEVEP